MVFNSFHRLLVTLFIGGCLFHISMVWQHFSALGSTEIIRIRCCLPKFSSFEASFTSFIRVFWLRVLCSAALIFDNSVFFLTKEQVVLLFCRRLLSAVFDLHLIEWFSSGAIERLSCCRTILL